MCKTRPRDRLSSKQRCWWKEQLFVRPLAQVHFRHVHLICCENRHVAIDNPPDLRGRNSQDKCFKKTHCPHPLYNDTRKYTQQFYRSAIPAGIPSNKCLSFGQLCVVTLSFTSLFPAENKWPTWSDHGPNSENATHGGKTICRLS